MPSQQQMSSTPIEARDNWGTPIWLFSWMDARFSFKVDLAASESNALCPVFLTKETDALTTNWSSLDGPGWCNPNYSNIDPWLAKAAMEARRGFTSVFLIPAPNGEDRYGKYVFGVATEVIHITGRIAFIDPRGKPVGGNTRGSCVVIYERYSLKETRYRHEYRDTIIKGY